MKAKTLLATVTALLFVAGSVQAQTVTHWLDRQIHGTARHLTPRHSKPGESTYTYYLPDGTKKTVTYMPKGYRVTLLLPDGSKNVRTVTYQ
jgi:hypothetical protein